MTENQARILRALRRLVEKHKRPIRQVEVAREVVDLGRLDGYLSRMLAAGLVKRYDYAGYLPADTQLQVGP